MRALRPQSAYVRHQRGNPKGSLGALRNMPQGIAGMNSKKPFQFLVSCVSLNRNDADDLSDMIDTSREITWQTFRRYVPISAVRAVFPWYSYQCETYNPQTGELTIGWHIKDEYGVSFNKSTFRGQPCLYIVHSAIEYIFRRPAVGMARWRT